MQNNICFENYILTFMKIIHHHIISRKKTMQLKSKLLFLENHLIMR